MSIRLEQSLRADWSYYGLPHASASRSGGFLPSSTLTSPPMGSSGMKKSRKGASRQHLAKVGTPAEQRHTLHAAEHDVVGNFGVGGKGWMFWTALVVIAAIVAFSLLGWILWF